MNIDNTFGCICNASICLSDSNTWKSWPRNFFFSTQVCLLNFYLGQVCISRSSGQGHRSTNVPVWRECVLFAFGKPRDNLVLCVYFRNFVAQLNMWVSRWAGLPSRMECWTKSSPTCRSCSRSMKNCWGIWKHGLITGIAQMLAIILLFFLFVKLPLHIVICACL